MAWNPSPEVAVARDAAAKLNAKQTIIVYFREGGKVGMASYGATKLLCQEAAIVGDYLFEKVTDVPKIEQELATLRAENQMLRDNLRSMANRVADQSELLSRRAERK